MKNSSPLKLAFFSKQVLALWVYSLGVAVCVAPSIGWGQDTDPYADKTADGGWSSEDQDGAWADQAGVIGEHDKVTSGGHDCPVIVVGRSVFKTDTLAQIAELNTEERIRGNTETALGNDGVYFALSVREKVGTDSVQNIVVFETASGKPICMINGVVDKHLIHLQITRGKYIVTGYYGDDAVLNVYKATDGSLVKTIKLSSKESLEKILAFSDNGHYLATVVDDQMIVHQVSSSKTVATMQHPKLSDTAVSKEELRRSHSNDAVFIYAWTKGLKFSPDGDELAAYSSHGGDRLMCWNKKAKLQSHRRFRGIAGAYEDEMPLEWFPGQNAWMLGGNIVDRESGRVVWAAKTPFASRARYFVHDQNTLIGRLHSEPTKLQKIVVPWDKIKEGLKAIEEQVPAHIAPYQSVDIKVEFGKTRGAATDAETSIRGAFSKRLVSGGMEYKVGARNYFRLRLTEEAGETLPIHERTSRFSFNSGVDTGRKAELAKGQLVVEYFADGEEKPMWNHVINAESGKSYSEEINQASIRKSMLDRVSREISLLDFPYFVPVDESVPSLPIIID